MFRIALSRSSALARRSHTVNLNDTFLRSLSSALPDHKLITMPALSPTMEVGTVQEWKKKEGDAIEGGEVLAEIETDKATRSFEYNDDGFIARVCCSSILYSNFNFWVALCEQISLKSQSSDRIFDSLSLKMTTISSSSKKGLLTSLLANL